jgi:hypothetical protein
MIGVAAECDLVPDDDGMFRFLGRWFAGCDRGVIELGWTDERDGKLRLFRRFELDEIEKATRFAAETNARPGCSLYFRAATVKPDTQYTHDGDVVQSPGCWCDCDTPESVSQVLAATDIVPSFQIVTGRIPTTRCQFAWQYGSPLLWPETSREMNRRAQALAGGDPAVINPSTLLRLPGSIAWPWKPGREPELTEWITPEGGGHRVSIATLRHRLPEVPAATLKSAITTGDLLNPIQKLIDQARAGPLWHDPVLRLVAMLIARGTPNAAILAMAEHLTWPGYAVAQTRDELATMIDGARRKGFGGTDDVMDVSTRISGHFLLLSEQELIARADPEWLVTDFVVADSLCVLYGQFSTFKSFLALDMALCVATGLPWCGRVVRQGDVLYIAGEGVGGLKLRLAAWKQHHEISVPIPGFRVLPLAVNLMDKAEVERLIATVTEASTADGYSPKLVIVDTLARAMAGGDENSAKDISLPVRHGGMIQTRLGCAMMLIHHAGKDADRGLRGSSGLPGATDTILRLTRSDDTVTLQVEKQKDHDDDQKLQLRSRVVDLPPAPGSLKPRSSLVLVPNSDAPEQGHEKLTTVERKALRFLADLIVAEGKPLPLVGGFPSPVAGHSLLGVSTSRWNEECESRHLSTAELKKNRGLTFRRAFQALLDKNAVAARDNLVWLTS